MIDNNNRLLQIKKKKKLSKDKLQTKGAYLLLITES